MKISPTPYYDDCVDFLRRPPESDYALFSEEGGFSYVNGDLGLAIALTRASKSNYEVTVIAGGSVAVVTEHNLKSACTLIQTAINNARKG